MHGDTAFAVFDVTDPSDAQQVDMFVSDGARSPVGLAGFKVGERCGVTLAREVSDTKSLFEIRRLEGRDTRR